MSTLQQNHAVVEAAIQRKDSLLLQAQHQWSTSERNWQQRLAVADKEKEQLLSVIILCV